MLFYIIIGLFIWAIIYGGYLGWTEDDRKREAEEEMRKAIMEKIKLEMKVEVTDEEDEE